MMPMPSRKPGFRKREIVLAVALGVMGAGGAALMLEAMDDEASAPPAIVATADAMTYEVAPFEHIATVGPQDVVITLGTGYSVRSEGSPQALALLQAVVEDGRLTIGPKGDFNWGSWNRLERATFYVTLPRLDGIALAGSGDIQVDRVEGERFEGVVGGPGEIRIGEMKVGQADFTVAGSGDLVAAGTAAESHVTIAGSGKVKAGGLRSQTATVTIGGSGDVALTVDKEALVSITGSGDVDIAGPGRCTVTRMGSGDVRCAGGGGDEDR